MTEAAKVRELTEAERMARVRARGAVPAECGPEIPNAPARGKVRIFDPVAFYPKGESDFEARPAGFAGRKALMRADVFDRACASAERARKPAPLSPSQIAMGRMYRDLVELHSAGGVRCSSLESMGGGGSGSGSDFMDARLALVERIEAIRRRIPSGDALVVRRVRPSSRGTRGTIQTRRLVDMVCLDDRSLSEVLAAHGWAKKGDHIEALRVALCDALERMAGPVFRCRSAFGGVSDGFERMAAGGLTSRRFDDIAAAAAEARAKKTH